jgi:hypothetical protein
MVDPHQPHPQFTFKLFKVVDSMKSTSRLDVHPKKSKEVTVKKNTVPKLLEEEHSAKTPSTRVRTKTKDPRTGAETLGLFHNTRET